MNDNLNYNATNGAPADTTLLQSLQFAMHAAGVGIWDVTLSEPRKVVWDDRCKEMFGLKRENTIPYEEAIQFIHEDDRDAVELAVQNALDPAGNGSYNMTYRTIGGDDGKLRWVHFIGQGYFNQSKVPYRFSGIALDVTAKVLANEKAEAAKKLADIAIKGTGVGLFQINIPDNKIDYSPATAYILTGNENIKLTRTDLSNHIHADDREAREVAVKAAKETGDLFYEARTVWDNGTIHHIRTVGTYSFDAAGNPKMLTGTVQDITSERETQQQVREIEKRFAEQLSKNEEMFRNVTSTSPTGLWMSDVTGSVTFLNKTLVDWVGLPYESLLGNGWINAVIEEDRARAAEAYLHSITHKKHYDVEFRLRKANGDVFWCRAAGDPFYNEDTTYGGFVGFCMDIHERVITANNLKVSETKLRSVIEQAPIAIGLFDGRNIVVTTANETILKWMGKNTSIIGMPLIDAVPELRGQPFIELLESVYDSGEAFYGYNTLAKLEKNCKLEDVYFDFVYTPLRDSDGTITGVMVLAIDVTVQVLARQRVEEAQASLLGAIELAELGTWSIDLNTGVLDYSERLRSWFGFDKDEVITIEKAYSAVLETDRHLIKQSMLRAINHELKTAYDVEYTVINKKAGRERIIHAQGKAFFNQIGEAYKITGTAQDVTEQRKIQIALKGEVQKRTEELQSVNEELTATNEELFVSNEQLSRSNEELSQYAYVASHDLQEPLRKIRIFSNKLSKDKNLQEEDKNLVEKISQSAERMSRLIQDLLELSRLLKTDIITQPVDLSEICKSVIDDFELDIIEKEAEVKIGALPVIEGLRLQMNQLFYNMLSNALKFIKPGRKPRIEVFSKRLEKKEVISYIPRPNPDSNYYKISFTDNGIGFDDKHAEQIFEVFKRLHGFGIYPGSGIGLALCKRIVSNHNGYLYAESVHNEGAAFHIILPEKS